MSTASHVADLRTIHCFDIVHNESTATYEYLETHLVHKTAVVNLGAFVSAVPGYDIGLGRRKTVRDPWSFGTKPGSEWIQVFFTQGSFNMLKYDFENDVFPKAPELYWEEEKQ